MKNTIKKTIVFMVLASILTSCQITDVNLTENGAKIKTICEKEEFKQYIGDKNIKTIAKNYINSPDIKYILQESNIIIDNKNFRTNNTTYNWLADVFKAYIKKSIDLGYINTSTLTTINRQLFDINEQQIIFGIPQDTSQLTNEQINTITSSFLILGEHYLDNDLLLKMGIDLNNKDSVDEFKSYISELIR